VKWLITASMAFVLGFALWVENVGSQPAEPVWRGHTLSGWLDAYRTNLSFRDENPPRSGFSDAAIKQALDGIGDRARPFLIKWIKIKYDCRWRWNVDAWLFRTGLLRFFHDVPEAPDWQDRAADGFLFYGTNALPLLPQLDKLTQSHDAKIRMAAYEAAFFSRPPKELFMPIADRALKEGDLGDREMAVQWMAERFTDEAKKRGLQKPYPQLFHRDP
jgi:hypothetical protein